jgi:hypothetical protein
VGKANSLDVIYVPPAAALSGSSGSTTVPVIVWNGTSQTVNDVDVSGSASTHSSVVGSGDSQGFMPENLKPGQVAFGYVFFETSVPADAKFNFSATASPGTSTYFLDAQVTQANWVPGGESGTNAVVGTVRNRTGLAMTGPISTTVYCFNGGKLTAAEAGFLSGSGNLSPGASGSYSVQVFDPCATYLVGASGFGPGAP